MFSRVISGDIGWVKSSSMTQSIFVASAEPFSGKSLITLGLVHALLGRSQKVGYYKPICTRAVGEKKDLHIETVLSHFKIDQTFEESYGYCRNEVLTMPESERSGQMLDTIIAEFKAIEEKNNFTIIEGTDYSGEGITFELETNITLARNLGTPIFLVVSAFNKNAGDVISTTKSLIRSFESRDVTILAVVINKTAEDMVSEIEKGLKSQLRSGILLSVVPLIEQLQNPTVADIHAAIGGTVLFGSHLLDNQVDNFVTGAMQVPSFLNYLKNNSLIVTPGDRGDIIICALQANLSINYPKVAGIILTAGNVPEEPITRLIEGLDTVVPIISVNTGTFQTTAAIGNIQARISPRNTTKINLAIETFDKYIAIDLIDQKLEERLLPGVTPHMFQYQITRRAKKQKKHIVLPEANDDRILMAASRLLSHEIVDLTLLGDANTIALAAKRLGIDLDLDVVQVINPFESPLLEDYVQLFYELRKSRSITLASARDLMLDVSYFGTMMVYKGDADGMVSGAMHTTQQTIRPALQILKTKPGISLVSSVFFMCMPDRVSVFGDCAVNPDPTAQQLAEIAIMSAESGKLFGIESKIAMLSYSSGTSGSGQEVDKVREATAIVRQLRPELDVEGPIQYDAAVDPVVGKHKLPGSKVAGRATILVFPDLNTGNNTYKAVQRETGALAIGPMLQGLTKPVNDLSRGCTVDDIFNTVIITAIQCQENKS